MKRCLMPSIFLMDITNPKYSLDVIKTAWNAGAKWISFVYINGGPPYELSI